MKKQKKIAEALLEYGYNRYSYSFINKKSCDKTSNVFNNIKYYLIIKMC